MSEQPFFTSTTSSDDEVIEVATASNTPLDISDILDEIDSVLENNATEFVRNFVQKGGQ